MLVLAVTLEASYRTGWNDKYKIRCLEYYETFGFLSFIIFVSRL